MPNDEQSIRELLTAWHDASVAGDLPKLLSMIDEDAVFLMAGHAPMRGRADGYFTATRIC